MKVLLPVDGSDYTKRMLGYVAASDGLLGTRHDYVVVTVVAALPAHATRFIDRATLDDYYRESAEAVLGPVRAFAEQKGWTLRTDVRVGHAAEQIAVAAEEARADLIVMGSHGHSAFGSVVLGSVASGVIARCKTPVLLIR